MTEMPPESPISSGQPAPAAPTPTGWAATAAGQPPPGPVAGLMYAGVLRRLVAYIIDIVLLVIAVFGFAFVLFLVMAAGGATVDANDVTWNNAVSVLGLFISAAYFTQSWRQRRATLGQRMLGLIVGNQDGGDKLTWGAAFVRWLALTLGPIPALASLAAPSLSGLIVLVEIGWWIVLLFSTATSPTKQGLHDRWARSLVVRRA